MFCWFQRLSCDRGHGVHLERAFVFWENKQPFQLP
jgi:hypothetical protein